MGWTLEAIICSSVLVFRILLQDSMEWEEPVDLLSLYPFKLLFCFLFLTHAFIFNLGERVTIKKLRCIFTCYCPILLCCFLTGTEMETQASSGQGPQVCSSFTHPLSLLQAQELSTSPTLEILAALKLYDSIACFSVSIVCFHLVCVIIIHNSFKLKMVY